MNGTLPYLFAFPDSFLKTVVPSLMRETGGYLLEVLEAVFHLHHLALVTEVFLVSY